MKKQIIDFLDNYQETLFAASDAIWERPEIAFQEYQAMEILCRMLEEEGFAVEKGLVGIPTAFRAAAGSGRPVIAFLGEFDALDGMSQEGGCFEKKEMAGTELGHGCGHHTIAAGAVAAAAAVKRYLEETGKPGTVVFYGCPGEEGGSGKAFMVRDGAFDGVDCAITWHPGDKTGLFTGRCLANISATYHFKGVSAHAGGLAHIGRSALDAVELMDVGANYLREHVVSNARIHYAITDTGGKSPNVVQSHASVFYYMRAPEPHYVKEMYERIGNIAKGAALMTGTTVEIEYNRGVNSLMPNDCLNHVMHRNMVEVGLPEYSEEDFATAEKYRETIAEKDVTFHELLDTMTKAERAQVLPYKGKAIYDFITPELEAEPLLFGSTDVGDVSMKCPTVQLHAATYAAGTALHSWQAVAQGKEPLMHKGELYAAKVMACTAVDLFENPDLVKEAQEELTERMGGHPFESLMPKDVKPKLKR
ncbi:MAG: amidohydrolase [Eubacteriales bacterium]|nr:amidohydrolase [Eubacteriales bacterium]